MTRAVLWDVGGPINTETIHEAALDIDIREELATRGVIVTDELWSLANAQAIASFAPNAYEAIIWELTGHDTALSQEIYERVSGKSHRRAAFELRPGIAELISELGSGGVLQGLAANQSAATLTILEQYGLAKYFTNDGVSDSIGYRKPDPRHFLIACERLGAEPEETIMVGDRIDNDIAPANLLGMTTVLFRTGRHIHQQPRSWQEVPAYTVDNISDLRIVVSAAIGVPKFASKS